MYVCIYVKIHNVYIALYSPYVAIRFIALAGQIYAQPGAAPFMVFCCAMDYGLLYFLVVRDL